MDKILPKNTAFIGGCFILFIYIFAITASGIAPWTLYFKKCDIESYLKEKYPDIVFKIGRVDKHFGFSEDFYFSSVDVKENGKKAFKFNIKLGKSMKKDDYLEHYFAYLIQNEITSLVDKSSLRMTRTHLHIEACNLDEAGINNRNYKKKDPKTSSIPFLIEIGFKIDYKLNKTEFVKRFIKIREAIKNENINVGLHIICRMKEDESYGLYTSAKEKDSTFDDLIKRIEEKDNHNLFFGETLRFLNGISESN